MRTTRTTGALGLVGVLVLTGCTSGGDLAGGPLPSATAAATPASTDEAPAPTTTQGPEQPTASSPATTGPSPAPAAEPSTPPTARPSPSRSPRPAPAPSRPSPPPPPPAPAPTPLQPTPTAAPEPAPEPPLAPDPAPAPNTPPWPESVPEATAIQGGVEGITVAWVAVEAGPYASDLDAAVARVQAVGYEGPKTPLSCQAASWEPLGVPGGSIGTGYVFGVPVYFVDAADAATFVELFDGSVAAVVEGDVFCHFD